MLSSSTSLRLRAQAELELRQRAAATAAAGDAGQRLSVWRADRGVYVNRETNRPYQPHHAEEAAFVASDTPRRYLVKGGEGSGKSVAGVIKDLERLRRGMNGIMGSPDFEHFRRSLWQEFQRWCPWHAVIPEQQYRARPGWEPQRPFILSFVTPTGGVAHLLCGGFDDPGSWEGPNVHFAHWDEARKHRTPAMLKVLDGRVRLIGPQGEPPQLWLSTTPRKHWLFDYFGPWDKPEQADPLADFKREAAVLTLRTRDNEAAGHLAAGYATRRRQSLTEAEARVLLDADWDDEGGADAFLDSMIWWDACRTDLAALSARTPLVLAADASVSGDCFAIIGVSRTPARPNDVAVRYVDITDPHGHPLDYDVIEQRLVAFVRSHNVLEVTYDPYQLHQMMTSLRNRGIVKTKPFGQQTDRLIADYQLRQLIARRGTAHDGHPALRQHIANADRKSDGEQKLRIVKRSPSLPIDGAVALSMAAYRCLQLPY